MALVHRGTLRFHAPDPSSPADEALPPGALRPLASLRRAALVLRPACAWCGRVQRDDGAWVELAEAVGLRTQEILTHVLCDGCLARYFGE